MVRKLKGILDMAVNTWSLIEHSTPKKPEMYAMAARLGVHRGIVVDACFELWAWFERNTGDGILREASVSFVDDLVKLPGFAEAMLAVHWLVVAKEGNNGSRIVIPNWNRHLSEEAKRRAAGLTVEEMAKLAPSLDRADGPNGQGWPSFLAQEWAFCYRGSGWAHKDVDLMAPVFEELMKRVPPERILARIRDKDRKKTEPPWVFERHFAEQEYIPMSVRLKKLREAK